MIVLVRIRKQGLRWQSEEVTTRKTKSLQKGEAMDWNGNLWWENMPNVSPVLKSILFPRKHVPFPAGLGHMQAIPYLHRV